MPDLIPATGFGWVSKGSDGVVVVIREVGTDELTTLTGRR